MDNQLNMLTIEGVLTSDVKLTYDDIKKTSVAKFYLKNISKIGQNTYKNDFYVVVYGKKADACAKLLSAGRKCTVCGKTSTWQKADKSGKAQVGVTVIASEVYFESDESDFNENDTFACGKA